MRGLDKLKGKATACHQTTLYPLNFYKPQHINPQATSPSLLACLLNMLKEQQHCCAFIFSLNLFAPSSQIQKEFIPSIVSYLLTLNIPRPVSNDSHNNSLKTP